MVLSARRLLSTFSSPQGTTKSSKKPAFQAAAAFTWLALASSSCSRRPMPHSFAISSQCSPIESPVLGSVMAGTEGLKSRGRNRSHGLTRAPASRPRALSSTACCSLRP